jgi:hypothetical protein
MPSWLQDTVAQLRTEATWPIAAEDHRRIAGHGVRIRYADPALAEAMGRSTRHLETASSDTPSLTIDCWAAPDPILMPPPHAPTIGTFHVDDGATILTWDAPDGPLFAYDRNLHKGWAAFSASAGPPPWEQAAPFSRILHWWGCERSLQLAHAAAVGHSAGGVLLVGRSGSGKSTTALACLDAGLAFAGDDGCLVEPGDPPWAHGLYLSAKGDANTARLLPGYREKFRQSPLTLRDKAVLFADDIRPDSVVTGFPLLGIVVPRLTGRPQSQLAPLDPAAALRALAPSTVMHMPGYRADGLTRLAGMVRVLPAWELTLGPNPATAAVLIKELLHGQVGK